MINGGILFVRPDFHSTFALVKALNLEHVKAHIFVGWTYPEKLLFQKKGVLGLRYFASSNKVLKYLNIFLNILAYARAVLGHRYIVFYGRPPLFPIFEIQLNQKILFSLELFILRKLLRKKIIFRPTGCNEEMLKQDFLQIDSGRVCNNCAIFNICDDSNNLKTFSLLKKYSHLNIGFGFFNSPYYQTSHIKYKSIDLDLWNIEIKIPDQFKLPSTKKIRILHSNFLKESGRLKSDKNIKGTPFIVTAVDKLMEEGYPIEKMIIENVPSNQMRFYQAQADIVVDQLIYGHWGSTAIECMALGKPVICYLNKDWKAFFLKTFPEYEALPIVEANEQNIYQVLKKLIENPDSRSRIGQFSREFVEQHYDPTVNARILTQNLLTL